MAARRSFISVVAIGALALAGWGAPAAESADRAQPVKLVDANARTAALAKKAAKGALRVRVAGLPDGVQPQVRIGGPGGYRANVRRTTTLKRLTPGVYKVSTPRVTTAAGVGTGEPSKSRVTVRANRTTTVTADYVWTTNSPTIPPTQPPVTPPSSPPPSTPPPADTTPPGPVTGLAVVDRTPTSLALSWTNPGDADLASVIVRRAIGPTAPATASTGSAVALQAPLAAQVADAGLAPGTEYSYAVFTRDVLGNTGSRMTVTATTETVDTTPPGPVTGLTVGTRTTSSVQLSWTNPADADLDRIVVRRAAGPVPPANVTAGTGVTLGSLKATSVTDSGLTSDSEFSYAVFAKDAVGNVSQATTVTTRTQAEDTTPPGPVTGLTVGTRTTSSVQLSWTNPADADLDRIVVRRAAGPVPPANVTAGTGVALGSLKATSVTDSGLTSDSEFSYAVFAKDAVGNVSQATTVTTRTQAEDTTPPGPVTGLTVNSVAARSISLNWSNPSDADLERVVVRRATGPNAPLTPTDGTAVTLTSPTATNVKDGGLAPDTEYSYAVFTRDTLGNTSQVPVTTTAKTLLPPAIPTGLTAVPLHNAVKLTWDAVPNPGQYRIYQGASSSGPWSYIGSTDATITKYTATGLTDGVAYWFAVTSVDPDGNDESIRSTPASATPQPPGGTAHCGSLPEDQTWSAGTVHVITCQVEIPWGRTLTIAPGAIVKGSSGIAVSGALRIDGTAADPAVLTSYADDTVGGDTNADGDATAPSLWNGISTWQRATDQPPSVTISHLHLSYAGVNIQNSGDDRDTFSYVERISEVLDSTFDHGASLYVDASGPINISGNTVDTAAENERPSRGISVRQQGYLSAVTVSGNTVSGVNAGNADYNAVNNSWPYGSGSGVFVWVQGQSTVSPVVQNNTVSKTSHEGWVVDSQRLDPSKLTGNTVGSGSLNGFGMQGTLISDLSLPFGNTPLVLTSSLSVGEGATLTVNPGVVVKSRGGYLSVAGGALKVLGTAGSPVTFTSWRDDSVGGDYNQDGDNTTPAPGDWGGISASTGYPGYLPPSVQIDRARVSYAGVNIQNQGDDRDDSYVARTTSITNSTFDHGGSVRVDAAGPVTVTGNTVSNAAAAEYSGRGISVMQNGYLSAVTVSGNTVSGVNAGNADYNAVNNSWPYGSGSGVFVWVQGQSTVSPVVQNNTVSKTSHEGWVVDSQRLDPSKLTGNTVGSGSLNGFGMQGTLISDLSLPFGNTPLVLTSSLSVGEGATLTVNPGVVVKSRGGYLSVAGGALKVLGTAGSPVTFTSWRDDSVGGDYNKDGTVTTPAPGDWGGISASTGYPGYLPPSVQIDRARVSYAGVNIQNQGDDRDDSYVARTTSITNSTFDHGGSVRVDAAGPVTVTGNTVSNAAAAEYSGRGISVRQQGYLSAVTVSGNTVSGVNAGNADYNAVNNSWPYGSGSGVFVWVQGQSTVSPVVQNNTVSKTSHEGWVVDSQRLDPSKLTGNTVGSGSLNGFGMQGTLISDLSLPFGNTPLVLTSSLSVGEGATLTVNPGVVVKSRGGYLSVAGGALKVLGTAGSPVTFTSWRDDSVGGDYNKDGTVTTPAPGDWGGISASTGYPGYLPPSVQIDRARVSYAGVNIQNQGDDRDDSYVARTTSITNSTFDHGGSVRVDAAGPVTVTGNTVSNAAAAEYSGRGISVMQNGYLSAVTVSGNTVSGVNAGNADYNAVNNSWPYGSGSGVFVWVQGQSTVSPVVQNNTVSKTSHEGWVVDSQRLDPSKLTGNTVGSGSLNGFGMQGTLISDLSLPFGNTPLVLTSSLSVGEGATLTVNPGVVVKSRGGYLSVAGGALKVLGTAGSPVTFTSWRDDSVGGDYNKDGTVTTPAPGDWGGISASSGGTADFTGTVARYASTTLSTYGDGGIRYRGKITQCSSYGAHESGGVLDVRNVDWGTPTGPAPFGTGCAIYSGTGNLLFVPWVGYVATQARNFAVMSWSGAGSSWGSYTRYRMTTADPVDPVSGNFSIVLTDVSVPEPGVDLTSVRSYNSQNVTSGVMGPGWRSSWEISVEPTSEEGTTNIRWGDGRIDRYAKQSDGTLKAAAGNFTTLVKDANGYLATTKDRTKYRFSDSGVLQSVSDSNGNTLTVTSDSGGRVTGVTDGAGRQLALVYNSSGLLTKVTDPKSQSFSFGYDVKGRLTQVTEPTGGVIGYAYDDLDRLVTATDALGNVTITNEYDNAYRVVNQTDARGKTSHFSYNPAGLNTQVTDPRGHTTTYVYDDQTRLVTVTDPLGAQINYTYDSAGNVLTIKDQLGGLVKNTYDARGNVLTVTDQLSRKTTNTYSEDLLTSTTRPGGATRQYVYDANRNLVSQTDASGGATTLEVSARGLVTSSTDPLGRKTSYAYNAQGDQTTRTDPMARTTTWIYDSLGRPTSQTTPAGRVTLTSYDALGHVTSTTDPGGHTSVFAYDLAGRRTSMTDPLGHTTTTEHDAAGLPIAVTDASGNVTRQSYDDAGNLLSATDPEGAVTTYGYDAAGRKVSEADPLGHTTAMQYDLVGRLTGTTDPLGHTQGLTYDAAGQLVSVTNGAGEITRFTYDAAGRQTVIKDANAHSWTRAYDAEDRIVKTTDPKNRDTTYSYDLAGQRKKTVLATGQEIAFGYDGAGQQTSVDPVGGTSATYEYSADGLLTRRVDSTGTLNLSYDARGLPTSATDQLGRTVSWTYDDASRLASRTVMGSTTTLLRDAVGNVTQAQDTAGNASWTYNKRSQPVSATLPNGTALVNAYDSAGRLTGTSYSRSGSTLWYENLTYDDADRMVGQTTPGDDRAFAYDAANRLASESRNGQTTSWTYDKVGNRLTETSSGSTVNYTYDVADQLVSVGPSAFTYDAAGNLTKVTSGGADTTYGYDVLGHLASISGSGKNWTVDVDADGQLLRYAGSDSGDYLYDRTSSAYQLLGGSVNGQSFRYLTGALPYARDKQPGTDVLIADHLATPRGWANGAGVLIGGLQVNAWGDSATTPDDVLGFAGGANLPTGATQFGLRQYDGLTGRFTTPDPTGTREGEGAFGPYTYASDDPLMRTDLTGSWSVWGAASAAWKTVKTALKVKSVYDTLVDVKKTVQTVWSDLSGSGGASTSQPNRTTGSTAQPSAASAGRLISGAKTGYTKAYNDAAGDIPDSVSACIYGYTNGMNAVQGDFLPRGADLAKAAIYTTPTPRANLFTAAIRFGSGLYSTTNQIRAGYAGC